jgi:general secretion pathway protein D
MRAVAALLLLGTLAACAPNATPDVPLRPIQPAIPLQLSIPPATRIGPNTRISPESSYNVAPPVVLPASAEAGGGVSLDFADTDIRTVVAQILGQILHVNYTIDPHVHGAATFHSTTPVARDQLIPLLQAVLSENGAAVVQSGSLFNVVPAASTAGTSSPGGSGAPNTSETLVTLRYASAANLAAVLQPFVGPGGKIIAAPSGNAVVLTGDPATQQTLFGLVSAFDVDTLAGQSYALLPISDGAAKDTAAALQTALIGKSALADDVRIVPLTRIDAILVVASRAQDIEDVRRVFSLIERNENQSVRSWNVYYLQASQANNLAYVLQQAFTPDNVTASPDSTSAQPAASAATSGTAGATAGNGTAGAGTSAGRIDANPIGNSGDLDASGGSTSSPSSTASAASANPLLGGLGGGGSGETTDAMRIIPDQQNNSLLIYATQSEDNLVNTMLAKLDVLPLQVRIDAVIAEVDLNNTLQYGTQFFFKSGGINGALNNSVSTSPLTTTVAGAALDSTFPGFIIGGNGIGGAPLALSALNAVTKVQVLSSPQLMVLNNSTAQLQVGSLVPYLTSTSQSTLTSEAPVINTVQYQPTGVIMNVTPRVNQDGLVMLKISQNVSSVDTTAPTSSGINSPTFLQRSITTSVVVQDGQTVGLAGLISDNASTGNSGIPFLKDIPILGVLAGTQNNTRARTELLVLITPYVVYNQQDARALTQDLLQSLPNAAAVPYVLTRPPEGNDDPNSPYRPSIR